MQTQMKQTRRWPQRLSTGLCWFIAVEFFLLAPFKFSPVGILGWPSYYVKFVNWGYPAWFSPVIGACELFGALMLTLPRRRFLGAVILVAILTGAVTTHIVDHDMLADNFSSPIELVLAGIAALTQWPADWREPLRFGPLKASKDAATHSGSSLGHLPSSSSVTRRGRSSGESRQVRSKPRPDRGQ
ncbi:MAG TPA: DoxX family protein [Ktedonobacteraceae bacterium]